MSLKPPVSKKDNLQGSAAAPIELVEYGDYQCPHCGAAYPIVKAIQKQMGDKLKFVFRNFPLAEEHPDATNAAIATEAAAGQGKFWEMHDVLLEHQSKLDKTSLIRYAEKIGLNVKKFELDFDRQDIQDKVASDFESGVRSGVNGTPTFFINGKKYNDSWDEGVLLDHLLTLVK
ncbi:MAG: DsbA family protein [Bacteroidia bacterium]